MNFFRSVWAFISDSKNRNILFFAIFVIIVLLLLRQCSLSNGLKHELEKQKAETIRLLNNESAKDAIILNYKLKDSTNRAVIQGYQLTQEELIRDYKHLVEDFKDLKEKTALALAKSVITIRETLYVETAMKIDSIGSAIISATDTMFIDQDNWRKITFTTPFTLKHYNKADSTEVDFNRLPYFYQFYPGKTRFTFEQSIGLKVGLFQDEKDKKVYIYAQSKYPGLTFSRLEGADIMADKKSRKITTEFRREWGLSLNIGYGIMSNLILNGTIATGPYIGIGLHYSPKFLQWGK